MSSLIANVVKQRFLMATFCHHKYLKRRIVHNVPHIGAETIVSAIKDVLLKLQLSLANFRGQCYDGASNMLRHKTGVAKRIQASNQRLILLTVMDTR